MWAMVCGRGSEKVPGLVCRTLKAEESAVEAIAAAPSVVLGCSALWLWSWQWQRDEEKRREEDKIRRRVT
jgi:hypothetical protein